MDGAVDNTVNNLTASRGEMLADLQWAAWEGLLLEAHLRLKHPLRELIPAWSTSSAVDTLLLLLANCAPRLVEGALMVPVLTAGTGSAGHGPRGATVLPIPLVLEAPALMPAVSK